MKNRTVILLVVLFAACGSARADMIEIKGRGILNGKIVSQDENGVQFKESTGNVLTVPKSDVLFLEAQKEAAGLPVASRRPAAGFKLGGWLGKMISRAKDLFGEARYRLGKFTNRARELAATPLDRSDADRKAKLLADTMQDATENVRKMAARDRGRAGDMKVAGAFYAKDASDVTDEEKKRRTATYSVRDDSGKFSSL